jgi:DNA-binding transcriptional LysR family regulator
MENAKDMPMDWDLIRTVLAIGRGGTLSAAARQLGINQTTVSRRLEAAEQAVGGALFLRLNGALVPSEAGRLALDHAAQMENTAVAFGQAVHDSGQSLSGSVEITATEGILSLVIAPALPAFHAALPGLSVVLTGGHESLDLSLRQADIALRLNRPRGNGLRARKLADIAHVVYGRPDTVDQPRRWLGYHTAFADLPESRWLAAQEGGTSPVLRTNSLASLCNAAVSGLGWALLPCYAGDPCEPIARQGEAVVWRDLWMVLHEEVARVPRVRAAADWLTHYMVSQRQRLTGGYSPP